MHDVAAQRDYWARNGPPVHIALVGIAAALGVKLLPDRDEPGPRVGDRVLSGPSIPELAASVAAPRGDTLQASLAIMRMMGNA